jgi:tRNA (mo5U34)-methyltransferase
MRFADVRFFHSFDLRDGDILRGSGDFKVLHNRATQILAGQTQGKSVLDIGAWDGFFSFEAERLGAKRVLATDHFCWSGPGWGTKDGFDLMHKHYNSEVESLDVDLLDLSPKKLGTFDIVLFLGVLYHLKDPFGGLELAAAMCNEQLIVETHADMLELDEPVMRYYLGDSLNGDPTNFWAPNRACLTDMLHELGFATVEFLKSDGPTRLLARATRQVAAIAMPPKTEELVAAPTVKRGAA